MLNLFQHLVVSMGYETLKQVQADISVIYTQTLIRRFHNPPPEKINHSNSRRFKRAHRGFLCVLKKLAKKCRKIIFHPRVHGDEELI
jgi:hypothetical protein